jgi:hypothetical protein
VSICRTTADGVIARFRAAPEKLPACTTSMKVDRKSAFIFDLNAKQFPIFSVLSRATTSCNYQVTLAANGNAIASPIE